MLEELFANSTPLLIPSGGPAYGTQRLTLDGRVYTIGLAWNQLTEGWFLSLLDSEERPIISGVRVVSNWPLLRWKRFDPRCPPGELAAVTGNPDESPPGFDDFGIGKRVQLTYFSVNG